MVQEYLTIQEAADLVNKSFQTLRRAIKSNKIKYRRQRTPQGFNYLIIKDSLFDYYKLNEAMSLESATAEKEATKETEAPALKSIPVEKAEIVINTPEKAEIVSKPESSESESSEAEDKSDYITKDDLSSITQALEKMISQHSEERQNFIRLINTLNEKIFTLESQVKLLSAPKKSWITFWKK